MLKRVNTIIQQTIRQNIGMGIALLITGYTGASFNLIFPLFHPSGRDEPYPGTGSYVRGRIYLYQHRGRMETAFSRTAEKSHGLCHSSITGYKERN